MGGVPIIYLHGNCPTLEKPSDRTTSTVDSLAQGRLLTSHQRNTIKQLKKEVFGEPEVTEPRKKKKRKGRNFTFVIAPWSSSVVTNVISLIKGLMDKFPPGSTLRKLLNSKNVS